MNVQIGHAVHDEKNKAKGGQAGDQTGGEILIAKWYNKPWTHVFRAKSEAVAEKIAVACEAGCRNNYIGYDQLQRTTLYTEAEKVGFDLSKITTPCEADCSSFVAVCVNAAGVKVSKSMYTGSELSALKKTGWFDIYTSDDYCKSSDKLKRGDILLGKGHTAMVLSNGKNAIVTAQEPAKVQRQENPLKSQVIGVATAKGSMHMRSEARSTVQSYGTVSKGTQLEVLEILDNGWYKVISDKSPTGYAYTSNVDGRFYTYEGENTVMSAAKESIPTQTTAKTTASKYVLLGSYNLRKTPGAENKPKDDIIIIVRRGAIFTATGESVWVAGTEWMYGRVGAYTGYISSKGLKKL